MPNPVKPSDNATSNAYQDAPLFAPLGVLALIVGVVIAFFGSQLIGVYVAGRALLPSAAVLGVGEVFYLGSNDGTIVSVSIIISLLLLSALTAVIIVWSGGNIRRYLALRSFSIKVAMAILGILLLFLIASQALTYLLDKAPLDFVDPLYDSVSSVWLLVLAMVIVAPIYEELIFRGLLWSAISEQFSGVSKARGALIASLVTSLIFAVIHLQYGLYEISTIVVLALIFCYARFKSGSLLLPILLHIINNGLAMWQYITQVA